MTTRQRRRKDGHIEVLGNVVAFNATQDMTEGDTEDMNMTGGDRGGCHGYRDKLPPFPDSATIKYVQLGEWLGELPNTISARYVPRVVSAHENLSGHPPLQNAKGQLTGYGAHAVAEYLDCNKDLDLYRSFLEKRYGAPEPAPSTNAVFAEIMPEEVSTGGALQHFRQQNADGETLMVATSGLLQKVQRLKTTRQQITQVERDRIYKQAFEARLEELGNEADIELVKTQARVDADRYFQSLLED